LSARRERAQLRAAARTILRAALDAADPHALVLRALRRRGHERLRARGRIALVAAGKAAVPMAQAAEEILGDRLSEGLAVSTAAAGDPFERTTLCTASHPLPDARGFAAAERVAALAQGLGRDDLLLVLLSGGASALLPAPARGISLQDKARTTELLLRSGATIGELNAVRKHLSRLKGGGLLRLAQPARVLTLVLSDVVGDVLPAIGSGPTVPDPTTFGDALAALQRRAVLDQVPTAVRERLLAGAKGALEETAKPRDPAFRRSAVEIVGSNRLSIEAAARAARRLGLRPLVLTTRLEGEAREVARVLAAILRECIESGQPARRPVCLLAGGETTVTVRGDGRGGRNQELALAAAAALVG
jgi:glycerate 2-kinase